LKHKNEIFITTNIKDQRFNFNNILIKNISFYRSFNPLKDLLASFKLALQIIQLKPDIIISSSPKGGLSTTLVNFFFQIPRIHIFTGFLWSEKKNSLLNSFSKFLDFLIIKFSQKLYLDGKSQINFLLKNNFSKNKLSLIAKGSMKGVNLNKFKYKKSNRKKKLIKYKISNNTLILLFLGRISHEKGIDTYLQTIKQLSNEGHDIIGFIVGRDEKGILREYKRKNRDFKKYFRYFNYTDQPESFLQLSDIVLIPSSREGFCQVAIEASACEVPIVGFDVIGLKDSIRHKKTGYVVPYNDKIQFKEKIKQLINDSDLRQKIGKQGREFVKKNFVEDYVLKEFIYQIENDLKKLNI
jgi:glycosyltransferase involved in cell wall biosynthesis